MARENLGYFLLGSILVVGLSSGAYLYWVKSKRMAPSSSPLVSIPIEKGPDAVPPGNKEAQVQVNFQFPIKQSRSPSATRRKENVLFTKWKGDAYLFPDTKVDGSICQKFEFRGEGYKGTAISTQDWAKVMKQFHRSKRLLNSWLDQSSSRYSKQTVQFMRNKVKKMRVVRPPYIEDPDLAWRGIGVVLKSEKGQHFLRLGTGFVRMILQEPNRALCEMTRMVAQVWAPFEFESSKIETPWGSLLKCFDISDQDANLEKGWAVSSSLAAVLSPPDCTLPVFKEIEKRVCVESSLQSAPRKEHL
jgi:hypothetical protein